MTSTSVDPALYPQIGFPEDPGLLDLPKLMDPEWVWRAYTRQYGSPDTGPHRIRVRQFSHSLGRTAIVSYEAEWPYDEYLPSESFAIRIGSSGSVELYRYPDDQALPGLREAADPEGALALLNRHVLAMRARSAGVDLVRYRPANRAVLRHRAGRVRFYARVVRPDVVSRLLAAHELMGRSGFVVPRLAGYWEDGGVVWLSEIPGRNLRRQLNRGRMPDAGRLLDGLQALWSAPPWPDEGRPFNLAGAYRRARRSFRHNLREYGETRRVMKEATEVLDPFVRDWRPSHLAHNDFYDDQMLQLRDGRVAMVDFEEAGPGDPLLDVGNMLAHLRWASRFGRNRETDAKGAFYQIFRNEALERFRWSERDLALREAVCLFRVCTNTIRRPQSDWHDRLDAGLRLVNEVLG